MAKKKQAPKQGTEVALEMTPRPAKYININTRHEGRGKDGVQLMADISVRGFHIDEAELNHILGAKAWNALFVSANGKGKPAEPMFRNIDPIHVHDEFEGCDGTFALGLSDEAVEFEDGKVHGIVLTPEVGGLTLMDFKFSTEIEDTSDVAALLECMADESSVGIFLGGKAVPKDKKAQKSLDLGPTDKSPPSSDAKPAAPAEPPAEQVH